MPKQYKNLDQEEIERVYNVIENCIMENHKLQSIKEILKEMDISNDHFKKAIEYLEKSERIVLLYGGKKGLPKLYIPKYMFNGILQLQKKPKWLKNYSFAEKKDKIEKISELQKQINKYEVIEKLLYGTGRPLEESVAYCLDLVGFQDVVHHKNDDIEDISLNFNGKKYLIEVKGKTKQAEKRDITQLDSWVRRALNLGNKADDLEGVLVINHDRREDPAKRTEPLTDKAKEFLKHYNYKFLTTKFLFENIKKYINKSVNEEIKAKIINGEKIE